jgi:CTP synthase
MVHFRLARPPAKMTPWKKTDRVHRASQGHVKIGVVGKYSELQDAYKSLYEAIHHGGIAHQQAVQIEKIAAEEIESGKALDKLQARSTAILVPGGFGKRGIEGKIEAIRYARENGVPFFGICLGLQCAVIEYARHVCGLKAAHSTEIDSKTPHPVVCLMEEQEKVVDLGATMRLGAWPCSLKKGTAAHAAYGADRSASATVTATK